MQEKIVLIDFGSQYTQLIARRIRTLRVYTEICSFKDILPMDAGVKGVILSGSPYSVLQKDAPKIDIRSFHDRIPTLGICYGAQYLVQHFGGSVQTSDKREYGRARLHVVKQDDPLVHNIHNDSQVWMSHSDTIVSLPDDFELIASTDTVEVAAYHIRGTQTYGVQFHPEVSHSLEGDSLLYNFLVHICACSQNWTPAAFIASIISSLRKQLGNDKVVLGLSGGVDSSVAALLLHQAIGKNLHCVFVDNGLLRKNEFSLITDLYRGMGLNVQGVHAQSLFLQAIRGISDPEEKRKIIGKTFISVFCTVAHSILNVQWLGQGTIYPDVIESASTKGPSATIKSHHNVGGLPDRLQLKLVEPLRTLFKDEVRAVGLALKMDKSILERHPFPGPGLAIRILGEVTPEKIGIIQEADAIYVAYLKEAGVYQQVWQAGAILLPVQSVGVMGDKRSYERVICLRAVTSLDGMTADWYHLPYELLGKIANEIINRVKGVNRVVYDVSSKPPATIEWE